ncbi:hypothetical protein PIB30_055400 [Stylosanthes scabra]|uniref:Uncharacterized protein n=1 Tax=Stylosanthes scabra TaxID=79078 RepID=A0ABU6VJ97_9FABA|nr:hypothetical protein [Stylosanthes scabra]
MLTCNAIERFHEAEDAFTTKETAQPLGASGDVAFAETTFLASNQRRRSSSHSIIFNTTLRATFVLFQFYLHSLLRFSRAIDNSTVSVFLRTAPPETVPSMCHSGGYS